MKAIRGAITEDGGVITATQVNHMLEFIQQVSDGDYSVIEAAQYRAEEIKRELTR